MDNDCRSAGISGVSLVNHRTGTKTQERNAANKDEDGMPTFAETAVSDAEYQQFSMRRQGTSWMQNTRRNCSYYIICVKACKVGQQLGVQS
jgi:hypothetical protein